MQDSFRTSFEITPFAKKIEIEKSILFVGSCFSENMGKRLAQHKLKTLINPFGIVYNPISLSNHLKAILTKKEYTREDLFFDDEVWKSFDHHSSFNSREIENGLEKINTCINQANGSLKTTNWLFITFGSAWVYEKVDDKKIVANCHKLPARKFTKRLLFVEEITQQYKTLIAEIAERYPKLNICFTVSPVRHWKDGVVENQQSKSTLLLAVAQLVEELKNGYYFPAYEIMMDDLRDYRFYTNDMLHPNELALDYIWGKFSNAFFSQKLQQLIAKAQKLNRAIAHKPFNYKSENHQKFIREQLEFIKELESTYPSIDLSDEKTHFLDQKSTG